MEPTAPSWKRRRPLMGAAHVLAVSALFLLVAVLNGRPAFFADTPFYYSQGAALAAALGYPQHALTAAQRSDPLSVTPGSRGAATGALTVAAARSPVYGLFMYLSERAGGLWLLVWIQGLAAAALIYRLVRVMAPDKGPWVYSAAALTLGVASSLPFFAAFAMPDVFAGLDVLCVVLLMVFPRRLSQGAWASVFLLLAFGAAAHPSHLLTLLGVAVVAPFIVMAAGRPLDLAAQRTGALAAAALLALGLNIAAGLLYTHETGARQNTPPFLMARVLEDGPGRAYLANHCPGGSSPTLCRFKGRALDNAEHFLWSADPSVGLFMTVDLQTRAKLKAEEPGFVLSVLIDRPFDELRAAGLNWAMQLGLFTTVEPLHNPAEFLQYPWWRNTSVWGVLPGRRQCEVNPASCQPRIPPMLIHGLEALGVVVSLCLLMVTAVSSDLRSAILTSHPERREDIKADLLGAALVVLALVVNAGVCGMISGPFPRYEARMIWLLPLISVVLAFKLPWRAALARFLGKVDAQAEGMGAASAPLRAGLPSLWP